MKLAKQWKGVTGYMIKDPDAFFSNYAESHGVGYPLAYMLLTCMVAMVPLGLLWVGGNLTTPDEALLGAGIAVVLGLMFWIQAVVEALVAHGVLYLFGARGVATTMEAYAFPLVVRFGLWWLPIVNLALGIYGLYLQIKGLSSFHDVSGGKAAVAVILGLVLYLPTVVILAAVIGTFVLDMGATP